MPKTSDTFQITKNGLQVTGPTAPPRNAYIRISVLVVDDQGRTPYQAWDDAVSLAYRIYGRTPTEDGTVGQIAQLEGGTGRLRDLPTKGRHFSFGINLYGSPSKKIHARIADAIK